MDSLDRPVWCSLLQHHATLSTGGPLARRYLPDVNLFAAARDETPPALAALSELVQPGERVFVLQVPAIVLPPGLVAVKRAIGVQMVATRRPVAALEADDIEALGERDAPQMLELARLTEPGPFLLRTPAMGTFLGIRDAAGRLLAMAGERFRAGGWTEVSGVCTHPDARGRGLARRLSAAVAAGIEARGERAFLHAWRTNVAAIALYESLGFELRSEVDVAVLERAPTP